MPFLLETTPPPDPAAGPAGTSWWAALAGLAFLVLTAPAGAPAREVLAGPLPAEVVRVEDGDTLVVRARVWLGQDVETPVRLTGIDAPEMKGRCGRERDLARRARDFLAARVATGRVVLRQVLHDKYGGRVTARVETPAGEDLAAALVAAGLARAYSSGARGGWCGEAAATEGKGG